MVYLASEIDGRELTNQLAMMETIFNASWQTNVTVGSFKKGQVKGQFGKLIMYGQNNELYGSLA